MFSLSSHTFRARRTTTRRCVAAGGFGLIELLVSISIIVLVTSLVLIRHSAFNSALLLRSQTYEIALQTREVQLFAVSAIGQGADFRNQFGVHFDTATDENYRYAIFRDANGDSYYSGTSEEFGGEQGFLDDRFEVRTIRMSGGADDGATPSELSVVFERPNFDARFFSAANTELDAGRAEIDIARRGVTGTGPETLRTLEITRTGQISVQ